MSLGAFDLTGTSFLILYTFLLVGALIAANITHKRLHDRDRWHPVSSEDELAYLAGGAARFAEAVTAGMLAAGVLAMSGRSTFTVAERNTTVGDVGARIRRLPSPLEWSDLKQELESQSVPVQSRLIDAGLLMTDADARRARFWKMAPFLPLLGFGVISVAICLMHDRPIGYLAAVMLITLGSMLYFVVLDVLTKPGHDLLAKARQQAKRLSIAPTTTEVGLAVALFGPAVLAGSGWDAFYRLCTGRKDKRDGDGSAGCSGCSGCGGD